MRILCIDSTALPGYENSHGHIWFVKIKYKKVTCDVIPLLIKTLNTGVATTDVDDTKG